MNTIHAIADPPLRYESMLRLQFCAPWLKVLSDRRDYFREFLEAAFPNFAQSLEVANTLIAEHDSEVDRQIRLYKNAKEERELYGPLQYLVNYALERGSESGDLSGVAPLMLLPTHNREILGCAVNRQ